MRGGAKTTGAYLLGFYLPGDVAGTGTVTTADLQTIKSDLGATPSSSNYSFDADVNRDGKISPADLAFASMNLGAKTTISPIITVNLDPATDGPLNDRITNHNPVHFTGTATPNATVTFTEINSNSPGATTTADGSGNYSIMVPLGNGSNTFQVTTTDAFGQIDLRPDLAGDLHDQSAAGIITSPLAVGHDEPRPRRRLRPQPRHLTA